MMQLVGNGALCMVDAGNAALKSGGEPTKFVLNFDFWRRCGWPIWCCMSSTSEWGLSLKSGWMRCMTSVLHVSTPIERRNIQKMDERLRNYQPSLDQKYLLFCIQVEGSEVEFMQTLKATDARFASVHRRADASAETCPHRWSERRKNLEFGFRT
ncbi:MAG: hypothetical protein ACLVES_06430 [Faecalibacterium prausnitzii]